MSSVTSVMTSDADETGAGCALDQQNLHGVTAVYKSDSELEPPAKTTDESVYVFFSVLFCSFFLSRAYMYAGAAGVVFFIAVCLRVCVKKLKNYLS